MTLNILTIAPEITVLSMACIIMLVDLVIPARLARQTIFGLVIATFTITVAFTILPLYDFSLVSARTLNGYFVLDKLSIVLKMFIYITSFFALWYSGSYLEQRNIAKTEFYVLALFSMLGMMIMVSTHSLLILYLGLELLSLPLYAMSSLHRTTAAAEGAIKFFITGAVASCMLLYGLSLLYGATGTLDISVIAKTIISLSEANVTLHNFTIFGLLFIVAGLAFKLGATPFHMWVPDVYQGVPTPVTALLVSASKIAIFGLLVRLLLQNMPSLALEWQQLLIVISVLSIILGNLAAITQNNFKRVIAYSSIAHIGYMLLGFIALSAEGFNSSMVYIIIYAITGLGSFSIITLLSKKGFEAERMDDLRGLNRRHPWLAFLMLILLFSMAGIPPTAGFFAKLGVMASLIKEEFVWLAVFALVFSVIGSYYYLKAIKLMYFDDPTDLSVISISKDKMIAISINSIAILLIGIFPNSIINICSWVFVA